MNEYGDIKVGSIVSGYEAGYWKVLTITDRSNMPYAPRTVELTGFTHPAPLVKLELVMDSKGNRPKKKAKVKECDIAYCHVFTREVADKDYNDAVAAAANIRDGLYSVLHDNGQ